MVNAKGSSEAFADAASEAAVTPRVATLTQGDRTIRGLDDSRDVARWAYGAKKGDVSEIFSVGKDYVIAMLTDIDDDDYASLQKVAAQVRAQVAARQEVRLYPQTSFRARRSTSRPRASARRSATSRVWLTEHSISTASVLSASGWCDCLFGEGSLVGTCEGPVWALYLPGG